MATCSNCGGSGRYMGAGICNTCYGSGRVADKVKYKNSNNSAQNNSNDSNTSSCLGFIIILYVLYLIFGFLCSLLDINDSLGKRIAFFFIGYMVYLAFKKWIDSTFFLVIAIVLVVLFIWVIVHFW